MSTCPGCGCGGNTHLHTCKTLEKVTLESAPSMVNSFSGQYRFLSNFWPCDVVLDGETYPSTEHAYQAAKTMLPNLRRVIREAATPAEAKKMGSQVTLRPDWEAVRLGVMEGLLRQKFAPGTDLRACLDETKGMELVEGNRWHDRFYGICYCKRCAGQGRNELGKLLMRIRDEA